MYLIIYVIDSNQEWIIGQNRKQQRFEIISKIKSTWEPKDFLKLPVLQPFLPFMEETYSYEYDEKPDYNKLVYLLQ